MIIFYLKPLGKYTLNYTIKNNSCKPNSQMGMLVSNKICEEDWARLTWKKQEKSVKYVEVKVVHLIFGVTVVMFGIRWRVKCEGLSIPVPVRRISCAHIFPRGYVTGFQRSSVRKLHSAREWSIPVAHYPICSAKVGAVSCSSKPAFLVSLWTKSSNIRKVVVFQSSSHPPSFFIQA